MRAEFAPLASTRVGNRGPSMFIQSERRRSPAPLAPPHYHRRLGTDFHHSRTARCPWLISCFARIWDRWRTSPLQFLLGARRSLIKSRFYSWLGPQNRRSHFNLCASPYSRSKECSSAHGDGLCDQESDASFGMACTSRSIRCALSHTTVGSSQHLAFWLELKRVASTDPRLGLFQSWILSLIRLIHHLSILADRLRHSPKKT